MLYQNYGNRSHLIEITRLMGSSKQALSFSTPFRDFFGGGVGGLGGGHGILVDEADRSRAEAEAGLQERDNLERRVRASYRSADRLRHRGAGLDPLHRFLFFNGIRLLE